MNPPPRTLGNQTLKKFDVIVIGSGAGGSAAAAALTEHGKKVLVLEAGPNYFYGLDDPDPKNLSTVFANDELKLLRRRLIMPDPMVEPRTFRQSDGSTANMEDDVNYLPKIVGGGAVHADLKAPRLLPFDFQLGTDLGGQFQGASFADWPLTYDELEPFYEFIENLIGVQGEKAKAPHDPLRKTDYPMKPGTPMFGAKLAAEAAEALGYSPFAFPTAINSEEYGGRPACADCGFCGNYGCAINAKSSPAVTTLRKALLTNRCLLLAEHRVKRLLHDNNGGTIWGVLALDPSGREVPFEADQYVLAASPIESARLLFLSDASSAGLGNSSGLVGRNLMFHHQTIVAGIFEQRLHGHRGRTVTHGMADFRGAPKDAERPLGGIVEFGNSVEPIMEGLIYLQRMRTCGTELWKLMQASPLRDRMLVLTMQGEDAPQIDNRIDLDPVVRDMDGVPVPRITYRSHPFELQSSRFYAPKLMAILEFMKKDCGKYGFVAPQERIPNSRHILGTLRFGNDPQTSVCNASGRFHDIDNLYAADGSLFPTSTGSNPTLTIMALATRVAGEMLYPGSAKRVLRPPDT